MNDEHIYQSFKRGSIEYLYLNIYPALISYAVKILGYDYAFLAEDCVQDSIYKTYLNRNSLTSASSLKSYLYTLVRNSAISILRKSQSKRNFLKTVEMWERDITNELIEQETLRMLFAAIDRLPESYRQIVEMSFEEGLKNAEIAQRLGISESAVKKRKAKMLEHLRISMSDTEKFNQITAFLIACNFFE